MGYGLPFGSVSCWDILLGTSPQKGSTALRCPRVNKTSSASGGSWEGMAISSNIHCYVFQGALSDFHRQKQNREQFREQNNIFLEQSEFPLLHREENNVWVTAFVLHLLHLSKEASFSEPEAITKGKSLGESLQNVSME